MSTQALFGWQQVTTALPHFITDVNLISLRDVLWDVFIFHIASRRKFLSWVWGEGALHAYHTMYHSSPCYSSVASTINLSIRPSNCNLCIQLLVHYFQQVKKHSPQQALLSPSTFPTGAGSAYFHNSKSHYTDLTDTITVRAYGQEVKTKAITTSYIQRADRTTTTGGCVQLITVSSHYVCLLHTRVAKPASSKIWFSTI